MDAILQVGLTNAVLATAFALAAWVIRRQERWPAAAHSLWILVLLKLVTPPLMEVAVIWPATLQTKAMASLSDEHSLEFAAELPAGADADPNREVLEDLETSGLIRKNAASSEPIPPPRRQSSSSWLAHWKTAVVVVWLIGAVGFWSVAVFRIGQMRLLMRSAHPAPAALQGEVRRLARRLGVAHPPIVWLLPLPIPPMLWALFGKPKLLLPLALWEEPANRSTDNASRSRAGPPAGRRPLGAPPGADRLGPLLVASRGLVGPPGIARCGRAALRCGSRDRIAGFNFHICTNALGYRCLRVADTVCGSFWSQQHGTGSDLETEVYHDSRREHDQAVVAWLGLVRIRGWRHAFAAVAHKGAVLGASHYRQTFRTILACPGPVEGPTGLRTEQAIDDFVRGSVDESTRKVTQGQTREADDRLETLEKRVADLLTEIQAIRREAASPGATQKPWGVLTVIDLQPWANVRLDAPAFHSAEFKGNNLASRFAGDRKFGGVPFRIGEELIQL